MVSEPHKAQRPPGLRNLPPQPTSFVGRGEELAEIAELLADPACRLLTLLGPGGIGKTCLAVEVAARMGDNVADGVYFVPLQGVQPGYLVSAIADEMQFLPLTLSVLASAGELLLHTGRPEPATELLALVAHHPASEREAVERVRQLLDPCEARLEPARFAGAVQRAESDDLASAVAAAQFQLAVEAILTPPIEPVEQPLVEPLTPREMQVLGLIAAGLSNRAIAEELVLAVGTVKWYTGQIYAKLGANSRTQAVARARELGILD